MKAGSSKERLRIWLPAVRAGSGADVFAMRLAEALRKEGHDPLLQWFDHRYELAPWLLKRVLPPDDIDVVHTGSWQAFAFRRAEIPLVVTEHQYVAHPDFAPYRGMAQSTYHRLFCERWARKSYAAADAIVAVSDYCASAMRKDISEPINVIHNWVDTHLFSPTHPPAARQQERAAEGRPFRLLFVGNPSRWKGADLLPEIASLLGYRFEIHCIGGLRAGFDAARLPKNMKLIPRMEPEQMPAVYRFVDAALVPTRYESFGYVALEAMACGLPVVGFESAGTAEVCVKGETALLAKIDDVTELASYARELAGNESIRIRLAAAGRQRAVEYFSEARAVAAYTAVYRQVMERSADRG